jgi:hypothetical protein
VETAVYIPNDPEMPMGGGYGIYLRRESHAAVLKEFLGIERDVEDEDTIHDLRILDVIDDIPSMDPFLLKSRLDTLGIAIPENCLHISAAEEAAMRRIIEMRIGPILSKAFSRHGGLSAEGLRRALDAIWNPALPESVRFVEAFGFHASETSQMFFALQGVAFYEYLFNETHSRLKPVAEWLNGPAAKPADEPVEEPAEEEAITPGEDYNTETEPGIEEEYADALERVEILIELLMVWFGGFEGEAEVVGFDGAVAIGFEIFARGVIECFAAQLFAEHVEDERAFAVGVVFLLKGVVGVAIAFGDDGRGLRRGEGVARDHAAQRVGDGGGEGEACESGGEVPPDAGGSCAAGAGFGDPRAGGEQARGGSHAAGGDAAE